MRLTVIREQDSAEPDYDRVTLVVNGEPVAESGVRHDADDSVALSRVLAEFLHVPSF